LKALFINIIKDFFVYLFLCLGTFLMARLISQYSTFDSHVAFLKVKQEYIHIDIWRIAFYTHVFSSLLTLFAGFTQFSDFIQTKYRNVHRLIGKIYAWNIFVVNFPAGMILAIYANGFLPSKIAFVLLDCLWFGFTLKAVLEIKRKNIAAHREYMIRSYALTCSAVTLRTWKLILSNALVIDPMSLYMIDAWLGWVPNLLFVEWLIRRKRLAAESSQGS
jgi:uncharacterized membrane protein